MSAKKATRWQVMQTASGQLGYVEGGGSTGRNGNITKFWEKHYPQWQGQPWCGAFVYWVLQQRGVKDVPLGKTGIFYTPAIVAAARSQGVWKSEGQLSSAQPGDLVLFDFDGTGNAKHVGFIEKYIGNGNVQTIEGNTSSSNRGSQNDGGGVYRRVRNGASIMGYVDMSKWVAKNAAELGKKTVAKKSNAFSPWHSKRIAEDGKLGVSTIRRLQAEVGTAVDGVFGVGSKKATQKWLGVRADGAFGPKSVRALQKKVKAAQDGKWGSGTTKALQRYLNSTRKK